MPRGSAVIRYDGARGTTWRVKYLDADGRQVMETLGRESDGWTRAKADEVLAERLVDVRREGLRRPADTTIADFARQWISTYPPTKGLKKSTTDGYRTIIETHLIPRIGDIPIAALDPGTVEEYVAACVDDGLSAGSVNRHLNLLSLIVKAARRRRLLRDNPVELVDRPREPRRRWRILTPAEVASVRRAFQQLEQDADPDARPWVMQASVVFTVVYGTGLRRGELLGLRWRHVRLADPEGPTLRVEETFVRNRIETPKSERSARTIPVGPVVADALFEHRGRTAYSGDDDRVFCHPLTGGPMDHKAYADTFRQALVAAGITEHIRPFHDGRHTAITNAAAAGVGAAALQARAGHADLTTTQRYIDLAGVTFRDEALIAEQRMFGVESGVETQPTPVRETAD